MKHVTQVIERHSFTARDFVGGGAVLDFVNTVAGRDQSPRDRLDGYPRLLEWAQRARLLPADKLRGLEAMARKQPATASKALQRAKHLREALFEVIAGMISGKPPSQSAVKFVNEYWQAGIVAHELSYKRRNMQIGVRSQATDLDLISSLVAYRFVEDVLPAPRDRLRICQGSNCAWLFLDRSKAGRRRWCDMAVCGNAAKSRRFYSRSRIAQMASARHG